MTQLKINKLKKASLKKLLIMILMIVIIGVLYSYRHDKPLSFFFGLYEYHHFCLEQTDRCITVITYYPPSVGDNPYKRFVVFGKKKYDLPLKVNHIEFSEDTGLSITWLSENECRIVSNGKQEKQMKLSSDVNVEVITGNELYQTLRSQNREHDVSRQAGKILMKKGETFILL